MADVAIDKQGGVGNSDCYEFVFDATDKTMAALELDPTKETTIAIKTTGSATVQVKLYMEKPSNTTPASFIYAASAATSGGEDWVRSSLGPIAGIECTGTITGGDGATIQILQSGRL